MYTEILPTSERLDLYREFGTQDRGTHIKIFSPLAGVLTANIVTALNHGFIGKEAFDIFAPAYALGGIASIGVAFMGALRWTRESRLRTGQIALGIAAIEGRDTMDPKYEISRVRGVLRFRKAINNTAAFELNPPIHPEAWEAPLDRLKNLTVKYKWFTERYFTPADDRGELRKTAIELNLAEWSHIENDPQKSDQERNHAARMYLAVRRLSSVV